MTIDEGNGSGRLSGGVMLIVDFNELIIDLGGSLLIQNCANVGIATTGIITNRGSIQIIHCDTALYDGGTNNFASVQNFGEITGSNLATKGISFKTFLC